MMTLNREHALELLALVAVIALVQWPQTDDRQPLDAPYAEPMVRMNSAAAFEPVAEPEPHHRLDPIALLQASVPDDWRVQLLPYSNVSNPALRC